MPRGRGVTCGIGPRIRVGLAPPLQATLRITGITQDSTGAPLGNCTVTLFRTRDDMAVARMVSDSAGVYAFVLTADPITTFSVVSVDPTGLKQGVTVNTLVAT